AYSPRPGTVAAGWPDTVSHDEKMVRLHAVEALQERVGRELNGHHLGQELEILVEGDERGRWMGRTRGNKIVFLPHEDTGADRTGQLVTAAIVEAGPWSLQGRIVSVIHEAPHALTDHLASKKRRVDLPLAVSFASAPPAAQKFPQVAAN
ncbi:MAG TPA: TRAM domain-containing protein, partial [Chloroflexia bacterium]|nr:TRAM domain-containing protein [Chloroflexia bacterium]